MASLADNKIILRPNFIVSKRFFLDSPSRYMPIVHPLLNSIFPSCQISRRINYEWKFKHDQIIKVIRSNRMKTVMTTTLSASIQPANVSSENDSTAIILLGVLVPFSLIILICILCVYLRNKNQREKSQHPSLNLSNDESNQNPGWIYKVSHWIYMVYLLVG